MFDFLDIIMRLYGPLLLSVFIFSLIFFINYEERTFRINVPVLSVFELHFPVKSKYLIRLMVAFVSLFPLLSYLLIDYSKLFSDEYDLEIFFDKQGIQTALSVYSDDDKISLRICENFDRESEAYYEMMDADLERLLPYYDIDGFYTNKGGSVTCKGVLRFRIKKMTFFAQNYFFDRGDGKIDQVLERDQQKPFKFTSFFELVDNKNKYIYIDLVNLLNEWSFNIFPVYRQILAEHYNSDYINAHHRLVCLTKVYIFPYPHFSDTVFLYDNGRCLIPISYGIHTAVD